MLLCFKKHNSYSMKIVLRFIKIIVEVSNSFVYNKENK